VGLVLSFIFYFEIKLIQIVSSQIQFLCRKVVLNQVIKIPIPKTANKTAAIKFYYQIPKSGKLVSTYATHQSMQ
jgi:hypothetical protein